MADRLRTDAAGRPVDLIGQPLRPGRGSVPGVTILTKEDAMAKADSNGVYTLNGARFKVRKGGVIPEGAEFTADTDTDKRAKGKAPENKSKPSAPENRAKKGEG